MCKLAEAIYFKRDLFEKRGEEEEREMGVLNVKGTKRPYKMGPREIKEPRRGEREENGNKTRMASMSGDNMRLTLYSGRSVIFRKGSVQFSQQTGYHKILL